MTRQYHDSLRSYLFTITVQFVYVLWAVLLAILMLGNGISLVSYEIENFEILR